jgi:hypothetical protein
MAHYESDNTLMSMTAEVIAWPIVTRLKIALFVLKLKDNTVFNVTKISTILQTPTQTITSIASDQFAESFFAASTISDKRESKVLQHSRPYHLLIKCSNSGKGGQLQIEKEWTMSTVTCWRELRSMTLDDPIIVILIVKAPLNTCTMVI